jgi:hypothetical protein
MPLFCLKGLALIVIFHSYEDKMILKCKNMNTCIKYSDINITTNFLFVIPNVSVSDLKCDGFSELFTLGLCIFFRRR